MERAYRLISYCIPTDDGAAPNPFFGVCSLTICKPVIRRVTAEPGDWVVGTGSKNVRGDDYSNSLVYAMKVDRKISMEVYDKEFPKKRPKVNSNDPKERVGDSIYDFSESRTKPVIRKGVHDEGNRDTDLDGKNALLSTHFYYFGRKAPLIPEEYRNIARQTQGHQYNPNEKNKKEFIEWLELNYGDKRETNGGIFGDPQLFHFAGGVCGACRFLGDVEDEERAKNHWDEGC